MMIPTIPIDQDALPLHIFNLQLLPPPTSNQDLAMLANLHTILKWEVIPHLMEGSRTQDIFKTKAHPRMEMEACQHKWEG